MHINFLENVSEIRRRSEDLKRKTHFENLLQKFRATFIL